MPAARLMGGNLPGISEWVDGLPSFRCGSLFREQPFGLSVTTSCFSYGLSRSFIYFLYGTGGASQVNGIGCGGLNLGWRRFLTRLRLMVGCARHSTTDVGDHV
jgi:hypothetical protein